MEKTEMEVALLQFYPFSENSKYTFYRNNLQLNFPLGVDFCVLWNREHREVKAGTWKV